MYVVSIFHQRTAQPGPAVACSQRKVCAVHPPRTALAKIMPWSLPPSGEFTQQLGIFSISLDVLPFFEATKCLLSLQGFCLPKIKFHALSLGTETQPGYMEKLTFVTILDFFCRFLPFWCHRRIARVNYWSHWFILVIQLETSPIPMENWALIWKWGHLWNR